VLGLPNAQAVAIADAYSRRREEAAALVPHVETLDDHRRLLERHDIDGVGLWPHRCTCTRSISWTRLRPAKISTPKKP